MSNRVQEFADRLTELERSGDVSAFVSNTFAADVVLVRPEIGRQLHGDDGAHTFWWEYLSRFDHIRSTFSRVSDGAVGVLEWTSTGALSSGTEITYAGVTLLDFDEQDHVRRFSTYYDTQAFDPR